MAWLRRWRRALAACMKEKSMRSTKMIVFALLNETGGCFLDPGLGLTPAVTKTTREAKCGHVCAIFWYNA